jgi:predicted MFS family arabinose efflux permease
MGPLSQALMSRLGWRYAFVVLGGVTALYALTVLLTLRNRPEDVGLRPYGADGAADKPETATSGEADWTVRQALRTRQFWALGLAQVLIPLGVFPVSVHQVAYLTDLGFSRVLAAGVLGYMGVMSSCGRLLFGALSDRLGRFGGVTLSVVFSQLGILALLMLDGASLMWPLYLYAVCFGLGYGARGPIISAIAADRFPGRSFATIFGFISIGHGLGGALGPWYSGAMYDRLGSYTLAFALACVSLCGVIGCFWVATRPRG